MKVTAIKTFVCNAFRTNFVFVKVETDSGLYGWGEATLEYKEHTVEAAIHDLEGYLIGKDPRNIEAFRHDCYRDAYWRGGPVLMSALAGVEIALWDIKGKELNVPVYQLLGGKVRDAIPIYVNGWFSPAKTPDEFAEKAKILKKLKFPGCKWDPFGKAWQQISKHDLNQAMECIEKVALSRVRHELPRKLALFRHAKHDSSAVLVQERAQRLAGVATLSGRFLHLKRLTFVGGNQFLEFFKCHTVPPQDILPKDAPSQALKQPITQPLSLL